MLAGRGGTGFRKGYAAVGGRVRPECVPVCGFNSLPRALPLPVVPPNVSRWRPLPKLQFTVVHLTITEELFVVVTQFTKGHNTSGVPELCRHNCRVSVSLGPRRLRM